MKVTLLVVGKTDKKFVEEGIDEYVKRIKRYIPFEIKVLPDVKNTKNMPYEVQMEKEADAILAALAGNQEVILLDENGTEYTSVGFANFIEKRLVMGQRDLTFIIGGPYGFSQRVRAVASGKLSLSKLTYSHQLVRVVFAEQLYRAFTIIRGEPYHHQ